MKKLARSGSLNGIKRLISEYFYGATIALKPYGEEHWTIFNKKWLSDYYIKRIRNIYYFIERG